MSPGDAWTCNMGMYALLRGEMMYAHPTYEWMDTYHRMERRGKPLFPSREPVIPRLERSAAEQAMIERIINADPKAKVLYERQNAVIN